MKTLAAASIDLVLADLPFGITDCGWDHRIPLRPLWEEYLRILKPAGAIILFAVQPFATDLVNAARRLFRYEIIWDKLKTTGFLNAHKMPLRRHENVLVFYRSLPRYMPPGLRHCHVVKGGGRRSQTYRGGWNSNWVTKRTGWPHSIIATPGIRENGMIPAQKPVALLEWLIRTYTRPGELVLDNVMGSGSTAIAAARTGRKFIGIELDCDRFRLAATRLVRSRIGDGGRRPTGIPAHPGRS